MTNELMNVIISAITGAVASGIVTLILDKRKEHRKEKKERKKEKKRIYNKRPALKIVKYEEYLNCPGRKMKKECDINIFITRIESVSVEDDIVTAHYNEELFNEDEWCCVIYCLKNVGKTDIECVSPICTLQKNTMLCEVTEAQTILKNGWLNYSMLYDRKVCVDESFTMRICYHKNCIVTGNVVAILAIALEDCNDRFWSQPLFAPNNKIYDSRRITYKEYRNEILPDEAIKCFKEPWRW